MLRYMKYALFLLIFVAGIWLGYAIRKPKEMEKKSEPEKVVVVTELREKEVKAPADTMDIMRVLIEKGIVRRYDDTMAVLRDYVTERVYDTVVVFKDGGSIGLTANVQYNRVESLAYQYQSPVQKKMKNVRPWISLGYFDGIYMGYGLLLKNRVQVGVMTNGKYIGGSVGYVF